MRESEEKKNTMMEKMRRRWVIVVSLQFSLLLLWLQRLHPSSLSNSPCYCFGSKDYTQVLSQILLAIALPAMITEFWVYYKYETSTRSNPLNDNKQTNKSHLIVNILSYSPKSESLISKFQFLKFLSEKTMVGHEAVEVAKTVLDVAWNAMECCHRIHHRHNNHDDDFPGNRDLPIPKKNRVGGFG